MIENVSIDVRLVIMEAYFRQPPLLYPPSLYPSILSPKVLGVICFQEMVFLHRIQISITFWNFHFCLCERLGQGVVGKMTVTA